MAKMEASLKVIDNTPALKGILGDRSREKQNHEARMTKLEDALEEVQDRQVQASDKEPEELEEEKTRHLKAMAELEEMYCQLKRRLGEEAADLGAKIKKEKEDYAKRKEELDEAFYKETGGEAVAENAITAAEAAGDQFTEGDCIYKKLQEESEKLDVAQQLTEEQLKGQAATMKEMFNEMKCEMKKTLRKEIRAEYVAESEEEEESKEGGDQVPFQIATGRDRNRQRRTRPKGNEDAIVDDSTDRKNAEKRPGSDLGTEEEDKEQKRIQAAAGSKQGGPAQQGGTVA